MKTYCKKAFAAMLALLLMVSLVPVTAYATSGTVDLGVPEPEVKLPVKVNVGYNLDDQNDPDDLPKAEAYTFVLKNEAGTEVDKLVLTGPSEGFFTLKFNRVGIYKYFISQEVVAANKNDRGHYDATVYDVVVSITNADEGDGLLSTVAIRKHGEETKLGSADFLNKYDPIMKDVTVYKKWEGGGWHSDSVTVELILDDEVLATGVISKKNDWEYTFEQKVRAKEDGWKIHEKAVAGRYVPVYQYDYEKDEATVINVYTKNLIQTGQLNWPIPVLCALGAVLMFAGCYVVFKKREDGCA